MAGLGNVSEHLSQPRLAPADLYAQPSSVDGRNLNIAVLVIGVVRLSLGGGIF